MKATVSIESGKGIISSKNIDDNNHEIIGLHGKMNLKNDENCAVLCLFHEGKKDKNLREFIIQFEDESFFFYNADDTILTPNNFVNANHAIKEFQEKSKGKDLDDCIENKKLLILHKKTFLSNLNENNGFLNLNESFDKIFGSELVNLNESVFNEKGKKKLVNKVFTILEHVSGESLESKKTQLFYEGKFLVQRYSAVIDVFFLSEVFVDEDDGSMQYDVDDTWLFKADELIGASENDFQDFKLYTGRGR